MTFNEALEDSRNKDCRPMRRRTPGKDSPTVMVWETNKGKLYFSTEGMSRKDLEAKDWYVVYWKE